MADSLVAEFSTQFEVSAAVDKLLSLGVARERLGLRVEDHAGRPAAPRATDVTSRLAKGATGEQSRPEVFSERAAHRRLGQPLPPGPSTPEALRHTCLLVRLDDPAAAAGLIELLRQAGASSVQRRDVMPATRKLVNPPQSNEPMHVVPAPPQPDSPPKRPHP